MEIGLLHFEPSMRSHFCFLVIVESVTSRVFRHLSRSRFLAQRNFCTCSKMG